jgi:hypothetical protein
VPPPAFSGPATGPVASAGAQDTGMVDCIVR